MLLMAPYALGGGIADVADGIASDMGYPSRDITVTAVKDEESKLEKVPLLGAWRIEGKTANSFFPIVIALSDAGNLFTEEIVALNAKVDALPDAPTPRGRGAFGSFSIGGDTKGGIHLSKHGRSVAVVSTLSMPDRGRDVRVSVECPFGPESLVLVPGGEPYFKNMSAGSGFNLKGLFIKTNQMAAELDPEPVKNTGLETSTREAGTPEVTSIEARGDTIKAVERSSASSSFQIWWIVAGLFLLVIIGGVLKVSSKRS